MRIDPLVILLVEDNEDHAELVIRSLNAHRIANRIIHLGDGEAALDYIFHQGKYADVADNPRPNLVLLDLRLPKVDGLDVLRRVKEDETTRNIPVVILTTSKAERDVAQAYHHHANSYLAKPIEYIKFLELMDELGFYWLVCNLQAE
jgi:CheY-like chemotaxis protein